MNLSGLCCAAAARATPNVHFWLRSAFTPSVLPRYLLLIAGCKSLMPSPLSGLQRVHARLQSITFLLHVHLPLENCFDGGPSGAAIGSSWIFCGPVCGQGIVNAVDSTAHTNLGLMARIGPWGRRHFLTAHEGKWCENRGKNWSAMIRLCL